MTIKAMPGSTEFYPARFSLAPHVSRAVVGLMG